MSNYPSDLKYTKDHEWAKKSGSQVVVGITFHAQDALGAVVYVELPKVGAQVKASDRFGVIESTKAVSDLFAPISGKVTKVNEAIVSSPDSVNKDPTPHGSSRSSPATRRSSTPCSISPPT